MNYLYYSHGVFSDTGDPVPEEVRKANVFPMEGFDFYPVTELGEPDGMRAQVFVSREPEDVRYFVLICASRSWMEFIEVEDFPSLLQLIAELRPLAGRACPVA
jgi:hypothetical protein